MNLINFYPFLFISLAIGHVCEITGKRFLISTIGGLSVILAYLGQNMIHVCPHEMDKNSMEIVEIREDQQCIKGVIPQLVMSVGVASYCVILFSMVPYVAMPQVLGKAYGFIYSLIYFVDISGHVILEYVKPQPQMFISTLPFGE